MSIFNVWLWLDDIFITWNTDLALRTVQLRDKNDNKKDEKVI